MKRDYKKIWWDSTFIKRLESMGEGPKPVTVKHGILFMIGLAVVVVCLWRVA